ncbi:MAG: hypothetical protein Q8M54_05540 [Desulfobaccales bacterium]|nr:hypothetical protein [Desulfobaccales bacterium]
MPEAEADLKTPSLPHPPGVALRGLILAYGAGTMISQVLILRELLVLAQGQELKLALGLWCWLFWVGLGSLWGGRRTVRAAPSLPHLGRLLLLLGAFLPATILAIRAVPTLTPLPWGQSLPPGTAFFLFLILLAPFGLTSGYFFPCACRVQAALAPQGAVGRVYYLETLGAALGVCLLQLFLLGRYPNLALGLGTGLFLSLCFWGLARPLSTAGRLVAALILLAPAAALFFLTPLEDLSRRWQWPGRQVVATADSPYALLTATREAEQYSFFANNLWYFTYPDPLTAEHQVQFGLLEHPQPRRVLLLGGGVAGLVPEILKTATVTHLDYVELDPQLVHLTQRLLPSEGMGEMEKVFGGEGQGSQTPAPPPKPPPPTPYMGVEAEPQERAGPPPRVEIIFQDARRFLATTREPYDVILMALPEPQNAQLNRYYTREFFGIVARRLTPQGVFSFSLTGAETSLHPLRAAYLALAYHTLSQVFPEVLIFPGERVRFFASSTPGALVADPARLVERLKARQLNLRYVREYYLLHDLSRPRQEYLRRILSQQPLEINTDLDPRCYFYDLVLSSVQEGLPLKEILPALKSVPPFIFWAALGLITLILISFLRRRPGPRYLYQVLVMGLGTMTLEIVVLILYQIHLGYLYRQLGILIAAFMGGMAAGGAVGARLATRPQAGVRSLAAAQGGLAVLAFSLALLLPRTSSLPLPAWETLTQAGFALVLAGAGFAGGGIFALSAALWAQAQPDSGTKGGYLYAADLLGATLGTLGASLLVLPVWGILPALYLVAALHAGAGLMVVVRVR